MKKPSIWSPSSWRDYPTRHQPVFQDQALLQEILQTIRSLPPLVHPADIKKLKQHLCKAQTGEAFILQAGDCAETFANCHSETIHNQAQLLSQMSERISQCLDKPTVVIGRIAGQYAKPRSSAVELLDGEYVPSFLGDNINGHASHERVPDPRRILQGYSYAGTTLSHLNTFMATGHLFTSHEGLLLPYEESMTRYIPEYESWYNLGAHMLWIGERTRGLHDGHVEYFRGIANPVGVKVGARSDPEEIISLVSRLNPRNESGKIILIPRYGIKEIHKLRPLLRAFAKTNLQAVWLCDPMHGNTTVLPSGIKTRCFSDISQELEEACHILHSEGMPLHGLHLEVSGAEVTECLGGSQAIQLEDLTTNYQSLCDPRLNRQQALDIANLFAEYTLTYMAKQKRFFNNLLSADRS